MFNIPGGDGVTPQDGNVTANPNDFLLPGEGGTPEGGNVPQAPQGTEGQAPTTQTQTQTQTPIDGQQQTAPKKFAGMFDSVEQLENAYKNLQTTYQTTKAKSKGLLEQMTPQQPAPQAPQQPVLPTMQPQQPQIPNIDPNLLARAYAENPVGTAQLLAQYAAAAPQNMHNMPQTGVQSHMYPQYVPPTQQMIQPQQPQNNTAMEYLLARTKYTDFNTLEPVMSEILQEMPYLANVPGKFDILHEMAIARQSQSAMQQAVQNGIAQGYQQATQKQMVTQQFAGGKPTGTTQTPPATEEDAIAAAILGEARNRFIL